MTKRGNVAVELEDIGEGVSGDYNEHDPGDIPLLRFTVLVKSADTHLDYDWVPVEDASYCTQLSATLPPEQIKAAEELLLDWVYDDVSAGNSVKKLCEALSWISTEWLKPKEG